MCKSLRQLQEACVDSALRNRPMQLTPAACATIDALITKHETTLKDTLAFLMSEYADERASALDGDPLARGKVREIRDMICELL